MPAVDAWERWAVPKASLTYTSHEIGLFLFLALVETEIFKENAFAVPAVRHFLFRIVADDVGGERHFSAQQLVEPCRDGCERKLFDVLFRLFEGFGRRRRLFRFGQSRDLGLFLFIQLHFCVEYVVGLAHMGAENDLRAVLHQIFNGGKSADDAVFVRDGAVLHGNVEVASDEDFFAADIYVFYGFLVHRKNLLDLIFHTDI